jgi:Zn-dependent membrane protease YugP
MNSFSFSTPGLLFPAVSLIMLAYTHRFLGLASLARHLTERYDVQHDPRVLAQVHNLRERIVLLQHTQALGLVSLWLCTACMLVLLLSWLWLAQALFGLALLFMLLSLGLSLREVHLSVRAINVELNRCFGEDAHPQPDQ